MATNEHKKRNSSFTPGSVAPSRHLRRLLLIIGAILTPIGIAGVILPILPGVPILILAAACFARSSPKLERWLINHPMLGPGIVAWRERGAISTRAKILAIAMMSVSVFFVTQSAAPLVGKLVVVAGIAIAVVFVGTRPNA